MRKSAGILMYRYNAQRDLEFLLVHPGGPFWKDKDAGAWSIPKGEYGPDEDPLAAAIRELGEETGARPQGNYIPLTPVVQKAGKEVAAWSIEGNFDPSQLISNTFKIMWPPKSGKWQTIPEVDRCEWFSLAIAREKINPAQIPFLEELMQKLTD